ncbi:uncharacterized protein N7515_007852 [Penicillium bovifimosum]|uniref:CUE domain-containing protein n=1 Tax=Penicillium bovifimosum TaxID=126998 RepID=A0A9W9GM95_9EURO|nr:uncharacterized protein N7515_007852 [Penicillium bovifimosum]KAJ5124027.1 hypothetical protein N7515_007852 [Penicillium bovifimosum]
MTEEEHSLNIPSLLTLAVVSYFVLRWFFKRDDGSAGGGRGRGRGNAVDPAQVEQIAQMFPQLSTRDIMWDLQRNGGVLQRRQRGSSQGVDWKLYVFADADKNPPPSFQPPVAIPSTNTPPTQTTTAAPALKADGQDLISRGTPSKTTWSQNKEERQQLLQKRRDDMILAARRKMMQKNQGDAQ